MKLLKTTIAPTSNFATTLKGDTIFGQLCWAVRFKFGEERLQKLLERYEQKPFLVVSDAFDAGYLPKPKLPSYLLNESDDKKENRKKVWITLENLRNGNFQNAIKAIEGEKPLSVMHNSINYKTFTTDDEGFAPYGTNEFSFLLKDIYCLMDEDLISLEELMEIFTFLSGFGYGKDATVGKGRFTFDELKEINTGENSKTVMTLSPFSPLNLECEDIYYEPFVRFGKKGALRANQNPFKKPLLLADTAAVIRFAEPLDRLFVGQAIKNHTTHEDIVHQGYAIALPIKEIV
jgi:CRISPR-associated protein Csm4